MTGVLMEHADQHIEAIGKTVRVKDEVSASVFDDKVKEMGTVTVTKGVVSIKLYHLPGMVSNEAQRDLMADAISLALKACYDARPNAFDPYS